MKFPKVRAGFFFFLSLLPSGWVLADAPGQGPISASAFKPSWSFDLGLTSSGTPGDKGGGQNANDLSLTATREFNDSGDFISLQGLGGSQKVEGSAVKYGSLSVSGGLGGDFFSPSLTLSAQTGDSALLATNASLNFDFQIFDDISVGAGFTGGFSRHQLPLSSLIPLPGTADTLVELDGKNWGGGFTLIWAVSDIFSVSLSGQSSNEITDQVQNLNHTVHLEVNQTSVTPSSSLGFAWAFQKDFTLMGSFQRSQEAEPAGLSYSPSLGQTVDNAEATTLYFSGYSVGLIYSFQ